MGKRHAGTAADKFVVQLDAIDGRFHGSSLSFPGVQADMRLAHAPLLVYVERVCTGATPCRSRGTWRNTLPEPVR